MGPNSTIDISSDLGLRNTDRSHDWFEDVRQHYPNLDLANVDTFMQQCCNNEAITNENDTID
ncbi:36848_t:CDS:1, partial [Racocetra persica]